ncbi:hypothetical protein SPONL_908 [uncultured Candidatus Thioglobus sp.]|nr:hypothetical protein SPONL_908 [uncultured Candidatus Thioglobus sp.]
MAKQTRKIQYETLDYQTDSVVDLFTDEMNTNYCKCGFSPF